MKSSQNLIAGEVQHIIKNLRIPYKRIFYKTFYQSSFSKKVKAALERELKHLNIQLGESDEYYFLEIKKQSNKNLKTRRKTK